MAGNGYFESRPTNAGADWGELSDPIAQIAARLGQLRAAKISKGTSPAYNSTQLSALDEEARPLQELLNQLMGIGQKPQGGAPVGSGGFGGGGIGGKQNETVIMDPYKEIREAAIKSAKDYMAMQNPHLVSNLTPGMVGELPKKMK